MMKNKEMFAREIVDIATGGNGMVAIDKNTGKLVGCSELDCENCAFNSVEVCDAARKTWTESEYKEPITAERLQKEVDIMCENTSCGECEYYAKNCTFGWIFDHYKVSEKEAGK